MRREFTTNSVFSNLYFTPCRLNFTRTMPVRPWQIPCLPYTTWHYMTLPDTTWHYLTLLETPLSYLTLPDTTSHYLTLPDTNWHSLTLPDTILHYLTLADTPCSQAGVPAALPPSKAAQCPQIPVWLPQELLPLHRLPASCLSGCHLCMNTNYFLSSF